MVFNKRDLAKAFSPGKVKRFGKKRLSVGGSKPSTSGSTASVQSDDGAQTNIRVIVRVRPHNERELQNNCRTVVRVVDDKMLIFDPKEEENPFYYQGVAQKGRDLLKKQNKEQQFIFDTVFDTTSSNSNVFEGSTKDLIGTLLDGYNCSVFAYGATGAGKTHTMLGSPEDPGITYRTVAELFYQIESQREHRDFNLGVTYLEIYNENVQDLLHKSGPLHIRDDGRCGIIVAGLKINTINDADELLTLLAKGNKNRTQHPTDANAESSRSHAVFQVYINMTNKLDGQVKHVKLSMIDLAGSERASATGCKGARFKEGANINKSLLALGNCINNLADGIRHIPYRDSKLTRLLKDSLGGNCQTIMIANIAPSSFSYDDTYNTLRYATRAKKIKTSMKKNIISCEMHVTGYIKMVEEQKKEINFLKQKLLAFECGTMQIQSSVEPKESKVDEELEKYTVELQEKLMELFRKKKTLSEKLLSLESTDKILCCRIRHKKSADERLHCLTASIDATTSEKQNASGKTRVNKSLQYFRRQREALKLQMESIWDELCTVEMEAQKLQDEVKSKGLVGKLADAMALQTCEIDKCMSQQQFEHAKKVSSLQQCEMQSLHTIIKMMSTTMQSYYNVVKGYGSMTEKMQQEFKQLIKLLEGVRNIKWSDMEDVNNEEDFYNLTCLSVSQLLDPLRTETPFYTKLSFDEDDQQTSKSSVNVTNTILETADVEVSTDSHNGTFVLDEKSDTIQDCEEGSKNITQDIVNNTFSLQEKAKKRVLSDKNQVNRTPTKQARKVSPPLKAVAARNINVTGKENKSSPKHNSVMSAKSIAILNKLKMDKLKSLSSLPKEGYDNTQTNEAGKVVRGKERRGLMTTHPYQKPASKHKFAPAPPSSRVPW